MREVSLFFSYSFPLFDVNIDMMVAFEVHHVNVSYGVYIAIYMFEVDWMTEFVDVIVIIPYPCPR